MAARKKFNIKWCGDCCVFEDCDQLEGHCRLNPPTVLNEYRSSYPVVRKDNPACFAGIAGSMPKPKGRYQR